MFRTLRICIAAAVAGCTLLLTASSASALTISPTGSYTTTSAGPITFTFASTGARASCAAAAIVETMAADGTGTVALGGARFSGCTVAPSGTALTINQQLVGRVASLLNAILPASVLVGRFYVIPLDGIRGGLRFSLAGCSWDISGNINFGRTVAGPLPVVIPAGAQSVVLSSNLTALNVTGVFCAALGIANGLTASATATVSDSGAITYSG